MARIEYHVCDLCGRKTHGKNKLTLSTQTQKQIRHLFGGTHNKKVDNKKLTAELCDECFEEILKDVHNLKTYNTDEAEQAIKEEQEEQQQDEEQEGDRGTAKVTIDFKTVGHAKFIEFGLPPNLYLDEDQQEG